MTATYECRYRAHGVADISYTGILALTSTDPEQQADLKALAEEMAKALEHLAQDVQDWCDAVQEDASWDGWDDHYKDLAYRGGLDKYRATLSSYRATQPKL